MRKTVALLLVVVALSGFARQQQDLVAREFARWRMLSQVYVPVEGDRLVEDIAAVGKPGVKVTLRDLKNAGRPPMYLWVHGRSSAGDGMLMVVYTRQALIPAGTTAVPMARVQAISALSDEEDGMGLCVDPVAGVKCRAALSYHEMWRLFDLLVGATKGNPQLPLTIIRRK